MEVFSPTYYMDASLYVGFNFRAGDKSNEWLSSNIIHGGSLLENLQKSYLARNSVPALNNIGISTHCLVHLSIVGLRC